jgi:hypothetical protein
MEDVLFGGIGQAQRWRHAEKKSRQGKFVQFFPEAPFMPASSRPAFLNQRCGELLVPF